MPLDRSSTTVMGIDATPQLSMIPMFSRSAESTTVLRHRALRVVVRNGTGRELSDLLLDDLAHLLPRLQRQAAPARGTEARGLDHATAQRKS
jgi:hypothetical protein